MLFTSIAAREKAAQSEAFGIKLSTPGQARSREKGALQAGACLPLPLLLVL